MACVYWPREIILIGRQKTRRVQSLSVKPQDFGVDTSVLKCISLWAEHNSARRLLLTSHAKFSLSARRDRFPLGFVRRDSSVADLLLGRQDVIRPFRRALWPKKNRKAKLWTKPGPPLHQAETRRR